MARMENWKRSISLLLVLALLIAPVQQVSAQTLPAEVLSEQPETTKPTIPEETEPPSETELTEETEPPTEPEPTGETEPPTEPEPTEETEPPTEPEPTEETEPPTEPDPTEETEPPTEPELTEETAITESYAETAALLSLPPAPLSIAEVLKMETGEDLLLIEGTVVFAEGPQAVLQDATGGIRLSFPAAPELTPGDVLRSSGRRSGGFAVEEFEKIGTGELPAVESTLAEDRNAIRILIRSAVPGRNTLTQKGYTCTLEGTLPEDLEDGQQVDAWGVILDGVFYADTIVPAENQEPESGPDSSWNLYFGQLHAHTGFSDGLGNPEEAFAYAASVDNLDFFAITDHSNSFDNAQQGVIHQDGTPVSQEWAAGKAAAAAATTPSFVGIFGYEMTWQEDRAIGHINTFGTPGWLTRDQEGMDTLEGYLDALAAVPDSVSQFNHPGPAYGDFREFTQYDPLHDARVHLLEVGSEGSFTAYDAYTLALDAGWHLAPSNNQNNHKGNWGNVSGQRTVVLANELTEAAIYDAVRNYRVYATADKDLKIEYRLNDQIMGSTIGKTPSLTADVLLEDLSGDPIGLVEVITDGGRVAASMDVPESSGACSLTVPGGGSYYYLRIRRDDGITAVTAPVWVEDYEDLGIAELSTNMQKPDQSTEVVLTLTLFNHESSPFLLESVIFSAGSQVIETIREPGSVAPASRMQIPLTYTRDTAGAVTITATVTGTIAGFSRSYRKDITLYFQPPLAPLKPIGEVRAGRLGESCRIRGYVTAGTANPYNTFPNSIYLQDDTGGIEIRDFTAEDIQVGTPMEIEGILRSAGGNLVLAMTDYTVLEEDYYRFAPRTMTHEVAMDYAAHGGQLLQIEGHVVSVTKTANQKGVSRFTLRDIVGDLATVMVENDIRSGAYGTNELVTEVKPAATVRVIGLLHVDEYGKTVLRVRNCDEVAYVPPVRDPSNPKTGDWLAGLKFR